VVRRTPDQIGAVANEMHQLAALLDEDASDWMIGFKTHPADIEEEDRMREEGDADEE
jgi:hypothetical protein